MLIRNKCLRPIALPNVSGSHLPIFRCGVCPNCIRHKKNELTVRFLRQLQGRDSVSLLTFTYDNEHCPVMRTVSVFDVDTGEVLDVQSGFVSIESERLDFFKYAPYEMKRTENGVPVKRFRPWIYFTENVDWYDTGEFKDMSFEDSPIKFVNQYVEYQSVNYEDMKLCLKRARRRGVNLTDFVCVPEYGSLGYRPHYHLLAIGLSQSDCNILQDCWRERGRDKKVDGVLVRPAPLGNVDCRMVSPSDESELRKVSCYLAKYSCKGKFDCPYIISGYCKKPRRSISEGFGIGSLSSFLQLSSDLLRWDLYGKYDPRNMSDELLELINPDALLAKRCIFVNGYPYPVPTYILNKIFGVYESKFKGFEETSEFGCSQKATFGPKNYLSTPLREKVKIALLSRSIADSERASKRTQPFYKVGLLFTDSLAASAELDLRRLDSAEKYFVDDLEKSQHLPM